MLKWVKWDWSVCLKSSLCFINIRGRETRVLVEGLEVDCTGTGD